MTGISTTKITLCKWSFLLLCLIALPVQAEVINDFTASYTMNADGSVLVEEQIVYDFEAEERHGIFRVLTTDHPQPATKRWHERIIDIEVLRVLQDSREVEYEESEEGGELTIKIGDPKEYIRGVHTYTVTYLLRGALSYGSNGGEFYYNVTGNGWEVPITMATAHVMSVGDKLLTEQFYCYMGAVGSNAKCTTSSSTGIVSTFTAKDLSRGEGLTIAQEINPTKIETLIVETPNVDWILWVMAGLWVLGISVWAWRFHQANTSHRPVIAQYEPYENFLPMYTGVIFDNALDPHDITAGILYLAEQGFVTIKRTEEKVLWVFNSTDYEVTLLKQVDTPDSTFLTEVAKLLFGTPNELPVTVGLSTLSKKSHENSTIVTALQANVRRDLQAQGFLDQAFGQAARRIAYAMAIIWVPVLLGVAILSGSFVYSFIAPLVVVLVVTVVVVGIAVYNRRSTKGHEALNHLEGFKLFLSVTDKERFAFHNAPPKSPEIFMKYLPYAIALKVEKEWAKVFDGITIPNPDWYQGNNLGAFSAAAFTSDMSAFSASFSSSSGTSGSSGGGSSGGGGGGGGGGSW